MINRIQENQLIELISNNSDSLPSDINPAIETSIELFKKEFDTNLGSGASINFEVYCNQIVHKLLKAIEDDGTFLDEYCQKFKEDEVRIKAVYRMRNSQIEELVKFIENKLVEFSLVKIDADYTSISPEQEMKGRHLYLLIKELGIIDLLENRLLSSDRFNNKEDWGFKSAVIAVLADIVQGNDLLSKVYEDYRKAKIGSSDEAETEKALRKVKKILIKHGIELENIKNPKKS